MENQHAESSLCWEIPSWVSSRSYALGTPSARSILTNARWWTNIVLAEASADFWAALPQRFSLADLADRLRLLGIDLEDGEAKREISNFLGTLHTEGCVRLMQGDNPCPAPRADQGKNSGTATGNVTSVEADFNDWLSDQGLLSLAFIELTYRCNQRCVHCFQSGCRPPSRQTCRSRDERNHDTGSCRLIGRPCRPGRLHRHVFRWRDFAARRFVGDSPRNKTVWSLLQSLHQWTVLGAPPRTHLLALASHLGRQYLFSRFQDARCDHWSGGLICEKRGDAPQGLRSRRSCHCQVPANASHGCRIQESPGVVR